MTIGIIGAGAMGGGIAQVAAAAGAGVKVYDKYDQALVACDSGIRKIMNNLIQKGKLSAHAANEILGRIDYAAELDELAGCDLVIEAIVEDLSVKKTIFYELESVVSGHCILATNTSSLSVTSIAAACQNPERVVGIHFFNPAPLMRLVEIIPAVQTAPAIVQQARNIIDSWGKTTVIARDTPGFIVNRVARPFYGEALKIYEEGTASFATIDWAMTEIGGFRMGPFALMDYIGHDVNYAVTESVFTAFYFDNRYRPSFSQKRMVEAGYLGKKAGRGFYHYTEAAIPPEPVKSENTGRMIVDRIVVMLINEAADALFLGIASRDDLDKAMTLGVNYPKGLLQWADDIGIQICVEQMDKLSDEYRDPRYRCSPLLRRMAETGETFY
ncbi:MAG: 3-hydroxyacyl-CoA dehydrogenase NAD-binding domain-containing protein [Bacteroidia bacterium]